MNFFSKANLSSRISNLLFRSVTPLQQSKVYSTKITYTIEESQQLTDCETQKSSESSSRSSDRIKEQIVHPRPREIPYQGKVANSVNLMGRVETPVHFEADSYGNHFAAIVISQEMRWEKDSLLIPVVFEGDLAHVVAYHVKENNRVLVSGRLSTDPMRFALGDSDVNFHIVADNLNFVEGFERKFSMKSRVSFSDVGIGKRGDGEREKFNFVEGFERKFSKRSQVSFPDVGIEKRGDGEIKESMNMAENDDEVFNRQWKQALEEAKVKKWGDNLESEPAECGERED